MTHIRSIPTLSLQLCETGPRWCKSRLNQSVNSAALKGVKGFLQFVQCRQIPSSPSLEKSQRWGSERTTGKPVCLHRVVFLFGGKYGKIAKHWGIRRYTLFVNHQKHVRSKTQRPNGANTAVTGRSYTWNNRPFRIWSKILQDIEVAWFLPMRHVTWSTFGSPHKMSSVASCCSFP